MNPMSLPADIEKALRAGALACEKSSWRKEPLDSEERLGRLSDWMGCFARALSGDVPAQAKKAIWIRAADLCVEIAEQDKNWPQDWREWKDKHDPVSWALTGGVGVRKKESWHLTAKARTIMGREMAKWLVNKKEKEGLISGLAGTWKYMELIESLALAKKARNAKKPEKRAEFLKKAQEKKRQEEAEEKALSPGLKEWRERGGVFEAAFESKTNDLQEGWDREWVNGLHPTSWTARFDAALEGLMKERSGPKELIEETMANGAIWRMVEMMDDAPRWRTGKQNAQGFQELARQAWIVAELGREKELLKLCSKLRTRAKDWMKAKAWPWKGALAGAGKGAQLWQQNMTPGSKTQARGCLAWMRQVKDLDKGKTIPDDPRPEEERLESLMTLGSLPSGFVLDRANPEVKHPENSSRKGRGEAFQEEKERLLGLGELSDQSAKEILGLMSKEVRKLLGTLDNRNPDVEILLAGAKASLWFKKRNPAAPEALWGEEAIVKMAGVFGFQEPALKEEFNKRLGALGWAEKGMIGKKDGFWEKAIEAMKKTFQGQGGAPMAVLEDLLSAEGLMRSEEDHWALENMLTEKPPKKDRKARRAGI